MLLLAPALRAQTGAIVSYSFAVYQPGVDAQSGAPFQTSTIQVASVACNQPPPAIVPATAFNPHTVMWDDPANTGRVCTVDQTTFLLALPIVTGTYAATLSATDDRALTSARSNTTNPFGRALPPTAPTGVRVR